MKLRITSLTVVLLAFAWIAQAQEVTKSDYAIQKNFKAQYEQIQNKIDTVSSVDKAQAVIDSIKALDARFQDHAELLNRALYPNTYSEEIEQLRKTSSRTLNRLKEAEQRTQKLQKLQSQLATYEDDLEQLNQQTDSLNKAMQQSIESEKQLSNMVRNYRNSLEKRDELILSFIDSMVVAYQQMDLQAIQNLEEMDSRSRLESDGDALKMLHTITMENLQILQENSEKLRLQDYIRMSAVQQEFQNMWQQLGGKITEVYDGANSEQLASEINQNLSEWDQTLRQQTFSTLSDSLQASGAEVGEFSSGDELYKSLNSYLTQQVTQSREEATEEGYNEYQQFQDFWNRVELQWSSSLADAGILTPQQMAEIDSKVDAWAENAQPESANVLIYILGAVVLVALVLGVLLIRERKNKA